jgi:nitroreductase
MPAEAPAMERAAPTEHEILDLLRRRWSPRAFSDRPVDPGDLARCFEAARWAPSSFNEQPWRFVVGTRERPADHARVLSCLLPANQEWARVAPVVAVACVAQRLARNGRDNPHARHDLGLAVMALTVQAMALDLYVHQMAGIDPGRCRVLLDISEGFEPVTGIAIGHLGDPEQLEGRLREQELAPRVRRALGETVFAGRFGTGAPWAE